MNNKVCALFCYIITAVLFLFYVSVLIGSAQTEVSIEYSMFYIEDKLAYFLEDGTLHNYGTNRKFSYVPDGMYRNQGKGWGSITEDGTWTSGPKSFLYFYVDKNKPDDYEYRLKIYTAESTGSFVATYVNTKKAGEGKIGKDGMYSITMPADCFRQGINEILLQTDADKEQAYIFVKSVMLEEYEKRDMKKEYKKEE